MKSTDLRAKARAIFGSAIAEPMPNQPNGAAALQKRANARPIPTYKVGGVVKKNDGGLLKKPVRGSSVTIPLEEDRVKKLKKPANAPKMVDFEPRQPKTGKAPANAPKPPAMTRGPEADDVLITTRRGQQMLEAQKRREMEMEEARRKKQEAADRLLGIPKKKDGGKLSEFEKAFAGARKEGKKTFDYSGKSYTTEMRGEKKKDFGDAFAAARKAGKSTFDFGGKSYTTKTREEQTTPAPKPAAAAPAKPAAAPAAAPKMTERQQKLERLRRDAEAPGASGFAKDRYKMAQKSGMYKKGGKVQTSADTAKKLAKEMGGMKKGGKMKGKKSGLAVMIAIGEPMKKPVKKAVGGAGKTRKGMMKG